MARARGLNRNRVFWIFDTLTPGMAVFPVIIDEMISNRMERLAEQIEAYAKANAPWEDRTGQARSGLTTDLVEDLDEKAIVLHHTADYGIWLEVRWSGRYAIIIPTIETWGPIVMAELQGIVSLEGKIDI